ncbi:MAG: biopolymer transporter ExbD [Deltaproteobacteria bacterium]|nr:biopolymer transporter ExbD [Deltaproteobacteria bacterium]NCP02948.1 biopolymer transporter ExbD [Deltaproteobacteria bacterium]NCP78180.1 biopolymer transporter ExbD [Desulfuromonadales bacterium]
MAFGQRRRDDPRVDLTPMVDVVFLLLIFFMISTTFIETPGLTVDLPKSSQQQTHKKTEEVRVYLAADGSLYLEQKKVSYPELMEALAAYGESAAETTFLLMADKNVKHGQVVQLMDSAKIAGFSKLSIATEKK